MEAIKILILLIVSSIALTVNAQNIPVIVDQDEFSVTIKHKGKYKTITSLEIIDAMSSGEMTKLPLPYSVEAKKVWIEYDEKMKIQMSKAKANPLGEIVLQNIRESLMTVFSGPNAMKEFIDKAVLGNGIKSKESDK